MAKITPAQLRNETRIAVERIRHVFDRIYEAARRGELTTWSDMAALRGAARTARQTFEQRPDADTRETRELAALAHALEALMDASLCAVEIDPPDLASVLYYGDLAGRVLSALASKADVPMTVYAEDDEPPQMPSPEHVH